MFSPWVGRGPTATGAGDQVTGVLQAPALAWRSLASHLAGGGGLGRGHCPSSVPFPSRTKPHHRARQPLWGTPEATRGHGGWSAPKGGTHPDAPETSRPGAQAQADEIKLPPSVPGSLGPSLRCVPTMGHPGQLPEQSGSEPGDPRRPCTLSPAPCPRNKSGDN